QGNGSHMDMMDMTLHFGTHETVLFKWWKTETVIGLLIACLISFLLGFFYEGVKALRFWLAAQDAVTRRNRREELDNVEDNESVRSNSRLLMGTPVSSCKLRVTHAFLHGFQSFFGLILMLIAMTFNLYIIVAVSAGMAVGFFLFHGAPQVGDNANDCC
ncbi:hypothetical protein PFISCL1PPCAC_14934, partial [Pristionchus fissidentatus]